MGVGDSTELEGEIPRCARNDWLWWGLRWVPGFFEGLWKHDVINRVSHREERPSRMPGLFPMSLSTEGRWLYQRRQQLRTARYCVLFWISMGAERDSVV